MVKPTGRPLIPSHPHTEEEHEAVRRWLLDTPVDDLAEYVLAGVDLDAPPMELVHPPEPMPPSHGPPNPPPTKTPSAGTQFHAWIPLSLGESHWDPRRIIPKNIPCGFSPPSVYPSMRFAIAILVACLLLCTGC